MNAEILKSILPLINDAELCKQAGISYSRFRNWKCGKVKCLTQEELDRITETIYGNAKKLKKRHG